MINFAKKHKLKIFILGRGSNVLLPDKGIKGLVLKMSIKGIIFQDNIVYAGAGEKWDKVVAMAVSKNLGGIENLSLIPGTVGGAVYQNIGAYEAELKDVLESVDVFDIKSGEIKKLSNKECLFAYRTSIFQKSAGKNYIIFGVILKLSTIFFPNIKYPDLTKNFNLYSHYDRALDTISKITLNEIRKAVIKIRKSKLDYPTASIGTAGSFFKNPVITISNFQFLISNRPDIKGRDLGNGLVKLSAGQLIEMAWWKGKQFRNVGVSEKHALVLVSFKKAKAKDILRLANKIQKSVKTKFGVTLEPEVKIYGKHGIM